MTNAILLILFPATMAFAASSDLLTMTISNRVSLILVAGFAVMAWMTGMSGAEVMSHAAAATAVLAVTFTFFAFGWIGGGDAKLAAATALWLGFDQLLDYALTASIFGGLLTILLMQFRMHPLPSLLARQDWVVRLHRMDAGIPYGIALAAAALAVYPESSWMKALSL
jgi:prepilin peptidase CpaA